MGAAGATGRWRDRLTTWHGRLGPLFYEHAKHGVDEVGKGVSAIRSAR